jgi:hypothetical protein
MRKNVGGLLAIGYWLWAMGYGLRLNNPAVSFWRSALTITQLRLAIDAE